MRNVRIELFVVALEHTIRYRIKLPTAIETAAQSMRAILRSVRVIFERTSNPSTAPCICASPRDSSPPAA